MPNKQKPSPTELVILKSLWKDAPKSAKEIHGQVQEQLLWSYSSTRKTIDRMLRKKYLRMENAHGINIYFPEIDKIETLAEFVSDLTQRVLEVKSPLPISMFSESKVLDDQELERLEDYINNEIKSDE